MTSKSYGDERAVTVETADLATGSLRVTSFARPGKIFTANEAIIMTIIGDLNEFDAGILPGVLKSSSPALQNFPNWNNLFKTGDLCDCEECRSVLGPAPQRRHTLTDCCRARRRQAWDLDRENDPQP